MGPFLAALKDSVPDDWRVVIQAILDYGRLDWYEQFGPITGEAYDEPGIDACCLPDIGGADAQEGSDETGAPPPGEEAWVPQPALACAQDCADQACRQAIREIRTQAEAIPGFIDVSEVSLRDQLIEISNWLATGQPCFDAMTADGVSEGGGGYQLSGTVVLPTPDARWPAFAELYVEGDCTIYDWYLPEQGEPNTCTGINDNNGEDPFGSGGPGGSGLPSRRVLAGRCLDLRRSPRARAHGLTRTELDVVGARRHALDDRRHACGRRAPAVDPAGGRGG